MIDWLTFRALCQHEGRIHGGRVVSVTREGDVDWEVPKWLPVRGSHDATIQVRSSSNEPGWLEVSGNPVKFFQGHNVFGTDDLHGLCIETMFSLVEMLGLKPTVEDVESWRKGVIQLGRVDVTHSYALGNRDRVRTAIRALSEFSYLRKRGRGSLTKEGTVYWGKGSRRWSLKAYCKGDEIEAKGHRLPAGLQETSIPRFADDLLRVELQLRAMELKRLLLNLAANWDEQRPNEVYSAFLESLQISEAAMLTADTLEGLSPRLQLAYQAWKDGHDLRQVFPPRTFYRYRKELLVNGVDIAVKQPREETPSNVIPLRIVLNAVPVTVPDWAIGTPLYFEPRRMA